MGKHRNKHQRSLTSWQKRHLFREVVPQYTAETPQTDESDTFQIDGEQTFPRRMEIWFAHLELKEESCIQGGDRPVLIVSNDQNNRNAETVNVLPMTKKAKKPSLPAHAWITADPTTGLSQGSMVLAEQITTIDKKQLIHKMGECSDELLQKCVHRTLYVQLGLERGNVE